MTFYSRYDVVIVGAGPAGLIAAIESYTPSRKIVIFEKMPTPAMKLMLTGKGRCNLTNNADIPEFLRHFGKNGRFLKYAFMQFFNADLLQYFEKLGIQCKLERGGRYFPQSEKAADVANALVNKVRSLNIPLVANAEVTSVVSQRDHTFTLTINMPDRSATLAAENVVLATGGKSYPKTGSSGTGFELASRVGHTITSVFPSLVPLEIRTDTTLDLQGIQLKNVKVTAWCDKRKVDEQFGEMNFTDFGVSGPTIFTLSRTVVPLLHAGHHMGISIDIKPALTHKQVEQRLLREIRNYGKQPFSLSLRRLLPQNLIPFFLEKLQIPDDKPLNQLTTKERKALRHLLKELSFDITGHRTFNHAMITSGGVCIHEIHAHTMQSKLVKGLYFAGEIIDIDADTGGFNLQAAFSTGWLAGRSLSCATDRAVRRGSAPVR